MTRRVLDTGQRLEIRADGGKMTEPAKKMVINQLKKHLRACVRARARAGTGTGTRALGL